MLNDGRLRLWIVLVVAERVAFQQVSTRKGLRADLTLIWLFLGVHAHVTTQVIESRIALGTLATGIQPGSSTWPGAGGRLGVLLLLLPRLSIAGGGRRVGGGGCLVLRARTLLRRFAVVLIDIGGGRGARASLHLHGLGSRRRRRRRRAAPAPGQMIARGTLPSQYCPEIAWAPPKLQPKRGQNARACAFAESQVEGISRLAPVAAVARWWSRARGRTAF